MHPVMATRKSMGLSGLGLSVKAKVSTATVVAIERYGLIPTEATQLKIARALGVSPDELFPTEQARELVALPA